MSSRETTAAARAVGKPRAVWAAIGLFCLVIALGLAKLVKTLLIAPGPGGHAFTVFAFIATYSVMALLVGYLAMAASWARGGLLAVILIGVVPGLPLALAHFGAIPVFAVLTLIQVVAATVAFFLVYRPATAGWFRRPDTTPARR